MSLRQHLPYISHLAIWGSFFTYLWSRALMVKPDGWYAGHLAHWTDGAAHLAYMSAFAYRTSFPLEHPLFVGHLFSYAFLADALGGLLVRLGLPLWFAYNLWGLALTIGVLILLWQFFRLVFNGKWTATLASGIFLLSGGLGWRYFLADISQTGLWPTLTNLPRLYTQQEKLGLVWLNVVVGELLPQRSFLLGLIFGLVILIIWHRHFILRRQVSPKYLILSGILTGLLPITHPHTLIVISLIGLIYFWLSLKKFSHWLLVGLPALAVGLPLIFTYVIPATSESFMRFQLGWMSQTKEVNWLWFWLDNWGLFFPLSILSIFFVSPKTKPLILSSWILFILSNLILFQPYEWDNAKILTWVYLIFSGSVALMLTKLWQQFKHIIFRIILIAFFFLLTFAGALDNLRALQTKYQRILLFPAEDVALAQEFRRLSSPESTVLAATFHDNWVAALTGRQVLSGYLGWMWTYGIDYGSRLGDMKAIYRGAEHAKLLLDRYGIDYVVIGPKELSEFAVNQEFFDQSYPVVLENSSTKVYQIN